VRPVLLEGRALHIFPCRADKEPACEHGFNDAVADQAGIDRLWSGVWSRHRSTTLIGVATGVISGIAVIDIDPRRGGDKWFFENRDRLPKTRTHESQSGGQHLIYRHILGMRCSKDKIASGVEIKADGGYVIWWCEHGCRVLCEGPVAEFPRWLFDEMVTEIIRRSASNGGVGARPSMAQATGSVTLRSKYLLDGLERALIGNRHDMVYWTSCRFGNMIGEGKMKTEVAECLLVGVAKTNGIWKANPGKCLATIRDGLREGMEEWLRHKRAGPAPFDLQSFLDEPISDDGDVA
jgi:hypothetical protein